MAKAGCLLFLGIIGLLCLELYVVLELILRFEDVLFPIVGVVVLSIIGWKLLQYHKNHLMAAFVQNKAGKRIIAMVGAVLLVIPGYMTGVIGLLFQIPFIQSIFAKVGNAIMASVMKRAMGGGFGKGFPGAGFPPGAFPGGTFPGGPGFPGGFPTPDDSVSIGRKPGTPKTYDVKADKE